MYSEYIIFTAYISMAYLNTSDDLVVLTCSNSRLSPFELPVHILMCWTNGTTLAVNYKYDKKNPTEKKSDIVIFVILCIYLASCRCLWWTKLCCFFWCLFFKVLNVAWSKALLTLTRLCLTCLCISYLCVK